MTAKREIKYRQFFNGKFHYWGYLKPGEFTAPLTTANAYGLESEELTGLLDKNGTEIYENDLVEVDDEYGIGRICWVYSYHGFGLDSYTLSMNPLLDQNYSEKLTVVGNIHTTPELLKLLKGEA